MATSIKPSEKWVRLVKKYLPYGKNLVKIGPVDPEFPLRKSLIFKKITQAEHIACGTCMPRVQKKFYTSATVADFKTITIFTENDLGQNAANFVTIFALI